MAEARVRILVVEDEPAMAEDICLRLEALGHVVLGPVGSAVEALKLAATDPPDLALMDVVLPGDMDGIEAAGYLQRRGIPVIYLTAHSDDALLDRAKITEPCGYLLKPYTERELQATVTLALYRHQMKQQLAQMHAELEQSRADLECKVAERTAHLAELNRRLLQEAAERHTAEQALSESTERFRALAEVTSDWVWEVDADCRYIYASPKVRELLGYAPEEVLGRTPFDFMPPEEALRIGDVFRGFAAENRPFQCVENVNRHQDGRLVVLETSAVPMYDGNGVFAGYRGIDRDITERKRAEQALRESERHLRRIIDLVPQRIFVKDIDGRFLLANRAVAEAYGADVESIIHQHQAGLHENAEEVARMLADDRMVIESGIAKVGYEESFTDINGALRVLRTTKIPYLIPGQERPAVLGLALDITEEKLNERRLIASEQKYRALLENAVDAILLADPQGNLIDANRRAEILLGYTRDELCDMHALQLHPPREHERVHEVFRELARLGNTLVEHPVLRKDGTCLQVEVAATLVHYGGQSVVQGIFRDVTERERRSKERLAQEQRHRDTLVREVHHRIKNNLQGVVGLLREHANAHPELLDVIGSAIGQVQSISVVHGLHGQGDDLQVRLCDMVQAIARNAGTLTRAAVEPDVQLAIERPVQVHQDEAVPVALIINELILNAVKHGAGGSGAKHVTVRLTQTDRSAEVCVINPGSLPAGFEFARGRGSGTGLGLVRSLLPHGGADLDLVQTPGEVHARLRLAPPVISV